MYFFETKGLETLHGRDAVPSSWYIVGNSEFYNSIETLNRIEGEESALGNRGS